MAKKKTTRKSVTKKAMAKKAAPAAKPMPKKENYGFAIASIIAIAAIVVMILLTMNALG